MATREASSRSCLVQLFKVFSALLLSARREAIYHSEVLPRAANHYSVGLERDEPALITPLGRDFFAVHFVVGEIAVTRGAEVDQNQAVRPHVPIGEYREALADFGVKGVHVETYVSVVFLHAPVGDVEVMNVLVCQRMADDPPVAGIVVSVFIQPQVPGQIVEVSLGYG